MLNDILEYIYPKNIKCIICKSPISKENSYSLCKDCFNKVNFIKNACIKCGKPLTNFYKKEYCPKCDENKYNFERALSCVEYDDNIHKIIYNFKYGRKTYLSYYIAQIMKDKLQYESIDFDYIAYVPLHKKRERKRGFNQAYLIAKNLSQFTNKPTLDIIERNRNTRYLSKLSRNARKNELKDVFTIKEEITTIEEKNILLVDDIFTSGSTTDEISKLLIKSGVNKVYVLCFATGRNIY